MRSLDRLLDRLVPDIEHRPLGRKPHRLHFASIGVHLTVAGLPRPVRVGAAAVATEEAAARARCAAELAERVAGCSPAVLACRTESQATPGAAQVPWQDLTPYGPGRLATLAARFDGRATRWCRATGMCSGRPYLVPAAKVLPAWALLTGDDTDDGECDASGLACDRGERVTACLQHGLYEVLERDALMLAWRLPSWERSDLAEELAGENAVGFARDNGLRLSLLDVGDPRLAPVVLCLLRDMRAGLACGSASAATVEEAAPRAALEAVSIWYGLRRWPPPARPGGPVRTSLDHVRWAWRHPLAVASWYESLPCRDPVEPVPGFDVLLRRCRERFFGCEPLVVDLAHSGTRYVCRVVQQHAMRKEWTADQPFVDGPRFLAMRRGPEPVNSLPHPYG
ncbi:YcaO-like family protein [Nonomuraea antri]|uniref:YcaO-like family protein n=1 Tax=Nonomuraea antri TaxID=2730852 RepID=UPI001F39C5E5|nr:YcaO-like family protein [Nonomuraea antri]